MHYVYVFFSLMRTVEMGKLSFNEVQAQLIRVSKANEVPTSSHVHVATTRINRL